MVSRSIKYSFEFWNSSFWGTSSTLFQIKTRKFTDYLYISQFLKKLNRQERVVEEVKLVLKPYYNKKKINKEEYKEIMRRAVPKVIELFISRFIFLIFMNFQICHNKSGEINPTKIKNLVEAYVKKIRHSKKVTSSSSVNNPVKV